MEMRGSWEGCWLDEGRGEGAVAATEEGAEVSGVEAAATSRGETMAGVGAEAEAGRGDAAAGVGAEAAAGGAAAGHGGALRRDRRRAEAA